MLIAHLIQIDETPVYTDDSPMAALAWSAVHNEPRVPIVDKVTGSLAGTIREDVLLAHAASDLLPMQALEASLMAYPEQHVFDVWHSINVTGQQVIPVTDRQSHYMGIISTQVLRKAVEQSLGLLQEGLTLLIETDQREADLHGIIGIIEKEGVRVLSMGVEYSDMEDESLIRISIRIEPLNADRAVSSLRRFGYAVHSGSRTHDDAEWVERADELIRYLDL